MKDKLLNQLIDEIDLIENYAFESGEASVFKLFNKFDKLLALHKNKAMKIIDKLRNL